MGGMADTCSKQENSGERQTDLHEEPERALAVGRASHLGSLHPHRNTTSTTGALRLRDVT